MDILVALIAIQIILLILKGTFVGKIFFMILKIAREIFKFDFMILSKFFKFINKMVKGKDYKNTSRHQVQKKVVNGNNYDNVIDFKKLKKNHRK